MRHLCCTCEEVMVCEGHEDMGDGEVGIFYACPQCGHRIALLTNRGETELARSLAGEVAEKAPTPVVPDLRAGPSWDPPALRRTERIPDFVRPIAIRAIERYAAEQGIGIVTEAVLDAYRRERGHAAGLDGA